MDDSFLGFLAILGFIALGIASRLLAGGMDRNRIRGYVAKGGGRVLSVKWAPFGTGWLGQKGDRIYEIRFVDTDGNEHRATCKTSLLSGVYFTKDRIVRYAEPQVKSSAPDISELERENRRLREELEKLRNGNG